MKEIDADLHVNFPPPTAVERIPLADCYRVLAHEWQTLGKRLQPGSDARVPATADDLEELLEYVAWYEELGYWIEIKKRLNALEVRRVMEGQLKDTALGEKAHVNLAKVGVTKVLQYLLTWNIPGADGQIEQVTEAALDNIDPDHYNAIVRAIDQYDEAQESARRAARKNVRAKSRSSSPTSPSADSWAAGGANGS